MPEDDRKPSLTTINAEASAKEKADNILSNVRKISAAFDNYLHLSASEIISYKVSLDDYKAEARNLSAYIDPGVMNQIDRAIAEASARFNTAEVQQQIRTSGDIVSQGNMPAETKEKREAAEQKYEEAKKQYSEAVKEFEDTRDILKHTGNDYSELKKLDDDKLYNKLHEFSEKDRKDLLINNKADLGILKELFNNAKHSYKEIKNGAQKAGDSIMAAAHTHPHLCHLPTLQHIKEHLYKMKKQEKEIPGFKMDEHMHKLHSKCKEHDAMLNKEKEAKASAKECHGKLKSCKRLDKFATKVAKEKGDKEIKMEDVVEKIEEKQKAVEKATGKDLDKTYKAVQENLKKEFLEEQKKETDKEKKETDSKTVETKIRVRCETIELYSGIDFDGDIKGYLQKITSDKNLMADKDILEALKKIDKRDKTLMPGLFEDKKQTAEQKTEKDIDDKALKARDMNKPENSRREVIKEPAHGASKITGDGREQAQKLGQSLKGSDDNKENQPPEKTTDKAQKKPTENTPKLHTEKLNSNKTNSPGNFR